MSSSPHSAEPVPTPEHPTRVRYIVVGVATLMSFLLYLDRFCLSFAERYITEDLRLSNAAAGWLLGVFFLSYAAGQVPSGWLSDRFGARRMLALYILLWSLFTGLMGAAFSFGLILLLRFGCGLAQAGAYPTGGSLLSKWVPFSQRGTASSIVTIGGRLGGAAAPILTAYLILAFIPLQTPSLLQPGDLLAPREKPDLGAVLTRTGMKPEERLAATIREMVAAGSKDNPNQSSPLFSTPASLLPALNEVLRRPDLYEHINQDEFALPPEARRLADIPAEALTPQQVERRNRLLLEAAYPDQVRKLYGSGWRPVMLVYGLAGLFVAAIYWFYFRDRPQEHPGCNPAEIKLIESGRPATMTTSGGPAGALPLSSLLTSRSLWLSSLSQFGTNFGWVFLLTWLPRYLAEVFQVPVVQRGWMAGLPLIAGMIGMFWGGRVTDQLTRAIGLRWGRGLPMALTRFTAMAAFLACPWLHDPWLVTAALAVVAMSTDLGTPATWAFMQDVGGRHVGSVLGWGNMWGNLGAFLSPVAIEALVAGYKPHGWKVAFLACAAAFFVAGVAALGIDATVPIVAEKQPPDAG